TGPTTTVTVTGGPYLNVQCQVPCTGSACATPTYTAAAKECTLQGFNWTQIQDNFTASYTVLVSPSAETVPTGDTTLQSWSVQFHSSTIAARAAFSIAYTAPPAATDPSAWVVPTSLHNTYAGMVDLSVVDVPADVAPDGVDHTSHFVVPV